MKRSFATLCAALLLAAPAVGAHAQTAPASPRQACAADAQKLCPQAQGRREIGQCLKAHQAQVSAACTDSLAQMAQAAHAMRAACAADIQKLCGDASAGGGAGKCLRSHAAEVSPGCSQAMQAARALRHPPKGAAPAGALGQ